MKEDAMPVAQDDVARAAQSLSVDLVESSTRLIKLLIAVDCFPHGGLYKGSYARVAADRYEKYWMPLLAARPADPNLVPPLDVAYAWLCHRLAPADYVKDCMARFGKVLHPCTPEQALAFDDGSTISYTAKLWGTVLDEDSKAQKHGSSVETSKPSYFPPEMPLSVKFASVGKLSAWSDKYMMNVKRSAMGLSMSHKCGVDTTTEGVLVHWKLQHKYNIVGAMNHQGHFLRHVLRACYSERPFLQRAVDRYLRFILLWRDNPSLYVVPTCDINLMWHAHMAHSDLYEKDVTAMAGKVLNHEDTLDVDDELSESLLAESFQKTKHIFESKWDMLYNPPLTQKVPAHELHPAMKVAGSSTITRLLAGPLPEDVDAVIAARRAADAIVAVKRNKANLDWRERQSTEATSAAVREVAKEQIPIAKQGLDKAVVNAKLRYEDGERMRLAALKARVAYEHAHPLQGGAALYTLYLYLKGMEAATKSWKMKLGCGNAQFQQAVAIRHMSKVLRGIPMFIQGSAPFSSSHPFWSEFKLVQYDSPVTIWRTPPGSAPGTLAATLAAVTVPKGMSSIALPTTNNMDSLAKAAHALPSCYQGVTPPSPPSAGSICLFVPPQPPAQPDESPDGETGATDVGIKVLYTGYSLPYTDVGGDQPAQHVISALSSGYCPYDSCAMGGAFAVPQDAAMQAQPGSIGDVLYFPKCLVGGGLYTDSASAIMASTNPCLHDDTDLRMYGSSINMKRSGVIGDVEYSGAAHIQFS